MNELQQIVTFEAPSDQTAVFNTLDTLQNMAIEKFHASTQAYFRYLSLGIHSVR